SASISISEDSQETESVEQIYKIEEIPLLTMNNDEYSKFLEHHQNKVVCLVDLPNFIRTLREFFPRDFENVLKKAHLLLLQYIENSFHTSDNYIEIINPENLIPIHTEYPEEFKKIIPKDVNLIRAELNDKLIL
ncbi:hypothetical protein LCGC14_1713220, partial [marine sediment metagenome]